MWLVQQIVEELKDNDSICVEWLPDKWSLTQLK